MKRGLSLVALLAATSAAIAQPILGAAEEGDWRYVSNMAMSEAIFADGALSVRCDKALGQISLSANPAMIGALNLITDQGRVSIGDGKALPARLSALDNLAFARGKFGLEENVSGQMTVFPWDSAVARSIEDCRI